MIPQNSQNDAICRFGVFELDLKTGELRKNGMKLRLQDQSYQVLLKLIESNGEMVSREELRSTLWHADTFVDFETGLNTAIKRLRETLGDSAERPTFIETLPRRGYRFIAPVELPVGRDRRISRPSIPHESFPDKKKFGRIGFAAAVAVLVLLGAAYRRGQPQPPAVVRIVRITDDGKAKESLNPPVTDGLHLYFVEGSPDATGSGIAQVAAAGGETTWISNTQPDVLAVSSVSPNRSELLFSRSAAIGSDVAELWVQPLPGGAPHRIGNIMALLATWTPDGTHIVYSPYEDRGAIMVANKDGSEPRQLAKVPGVVFSIRYSPDGQRIRFDVADPRTEFNSIWEMDSDGKNIHPAFPNWKESSFHAVGNWSPDGDYYYFVAGHGNEQAIWVMPERRSIFGRKARGPSQLTYGPLHFSNPVPSGDGKRVFVLGEDPRVELVRYDPHARRFDSYLRGLSAGPVDFSANRKWIAYISYPDMTLWRSRVDGRDKMQLTFPPVRAYEPRWSPDGSQIVFMDVRFDSPWKICLVSPSGGSPEVLLPGKTQGADPTWTPDGKSIVFGDHSGRPFEKNEKSAVHVLDLKTRTISSVRDSDDMFSPRLSPNGRYLTAISLGDKKLMLFDTSTMHWSTLAEGEGFGYNEWSHDSKYVYLRQNPRGTGELVRVRIKDHALEHVLNFKDFPQLDDPVALWIGLTPEDTPILMRNRSVQEIYAIDLQFH